MKRNNYFLLVLTFLAGSIFMGSLIGVVSYANHSNSPNPAPPADSIGTADANNYFKNYLLSATPYKDTFKGFYIDKEQYDAMTILLKKNQYLPGFRIYFGLINTDKVGMVVGAINASTDALNYGIYKTTARNLGPCPPICDAISPITK